MSKANVAVKEEQANALALVSTFEEDAQGGFDGMNHPRDGFGSRHPNADPSHDRLFLFLKKQESIMEWR